MSESEVEAMTEREIEKIEKRVEAADEGLGNLRADAGLWIDDRCIDDEVEEAYGEIRNNASGPEKSLEDIPNLIAEVRRSRAEAAELREEVERLQTAVDCYEELALHKSGMEHLVNLLQRENQGLEQENAELRERLEYAEGHLRKIRDFEGGTPAGRAFASRVTAKDYFTTLSRANAQAKPEKEG